MKYLKFLGVAVVAMFALGAMVTTAFALPDISIALGGAYPLHLEITVLTGTHLANVSSEGLRSKENVGSLLLLFLIKELTSLGTFEALFTKVHKIKAGGEGEECNSEGDPAGEVLTNGTFHIVYTNLSPLRLGILFLLKELKVLCGTTKIRIKGSVLSSLNKPAGEEETTEAGGELLEGASEGKPKLTSWFNDAGGTENAKLESNFGTGFVESAEVAEKEVVTKALESKMFTITSR